MSPTDLQDYLFQEPFVPVRLTFSSGDQLIVDNPHRALIVGLALHYGIADHPASRIGQRLRIISIPNIVLVEPITGNGRRRGRRRR